MPKAIAAPRSVNWGSLPALMQEVGADSFVVTGAANLLVGVIIAFLGISQLGRFGAVSFVPELVIVAQFRELGPLVTAIVVASRSGRASSEIATMMSEEVMRCGRWGSIRCSGWCCPVSGARRGGSAPDLDRRRAGGLRRFPRHDRDHQHPAARVSDRHRRGDHGHAFLHRPDQDAVSGAGNRLDRLRSRADRVGGAAGVGARTTSAVVRSIFSVIVINSLFTFFYVFMGI